MRALARRCVDPSGDALEKDQAALSRLVGVSRARVTQVMDLLYLAPDIQEGLLWLVRVDDGRDNFGHVPLARIASEPLWVEQRRLWISIATG